MKKQNLKTEIRTITLPDNQGVLSIYNHQNNQIIIQRYAARGKIKNHLDKYEFINKNDISELRPLDIKTANHILDRAEAGEPYSGIFIFYEDRRKQMVELTRDKSEQEHKYTSTGIKFWRHQQQMESYKTNNGHSIISTHISPEGACDRSCPYCSVTYRSTHSRIGLPVIKDYVQKLKTRGLKACILSGGGEPQLYKHFDELVQWLKYDQGLEVALITNGTMFRKRETKTLAAFSWIRISINLFEDWENAIGKDFNLEHLDTNCIVGCSMVYTVEHEATDEFMTNRVDVLKKAAKIADRVKAQYIRLLPNCLLEQNHLIRQHYALDKTLEELNDSRFFHQYKIHGSPRCNTCHQSYFRPYLSEEPYHKDNEPGTVYPCDSVVLNNSYQFFAHKYQLCKPQEILDYLDGKLEQPFQAKVECDGCVFTDNVNMLDDWKNGKINKFDEFKEPLKHENFV